MTRAGRVAMPTDDADLSQHSALIKGLRVLEVVATHERLSDIARTTGLSYSTVHRILADLVATVVTRTPTGATIPVPDPVVLRTCSRKMTTISIRSSRTCSSCATRPRRSGGAPRPPPHVHRQARRPGRASDAFLRGNAAAAALHGHRQGRPRHDERGPGCEGPGGSTGASPHPQDRGHPTTALRPARCDLPPRVGPGRRRERGGHQVRRRRRRARRSGRHRRPEHVGSGP